MIADQMRKLITFNSWAWQRVFISIEQPDDQAYYAPRQLFEGSIYSTLVLGNRLDQQQRDRRADCMHDP